MFSFKTLSWPHQSYNLQTAKQHENIKVKKKNDQPEPKFKFYKKPKDMTQEVNNVKFLVLSTNQYATSN